MRCVGNSLYFLLAIKFDTSSGVFLSRNHGKNGNLVVNILVDNLKNDIILLPECFWCSSDALFLKKNLQNRFSRFHHAQKKLIESTTKTIPHYMIYINLLLVFFENGKKLLAKPRLLLYRALSWTHKIVTFSGLQRWPPFGESKGHGLKKRKR